MRCENPNILPADGHDICNYVARYGLASFQIQTVMKLDGRLDFDRLRRAVRLSVEVEPVFGCRFIKDKKPYWKRRCDLDTVDFCLFIETNNLSEAVHRFLASPLDMDNDPMVKILLLRSDESDTLCIKLNHTCCDGAGTKEYLELLADIYSHIDGEMEDFLPEPSIRDKKDHYTLFNTLGINNPDKIKNRQVQIPLSMWKFPWKNRKQKGVRIAVCRLSQGQLEEVKNYGKVKGATINDLILTAFYRAMFKMTNPLYGVPMDISLTVDLRRYLPDNKTEAIRNLSGGINTRIARKVHEPFNGTLCRVMRVMNKAKKGHPGVENAIAAERVEKADFRKSNAFYKAMSKIDDIVTLYPFSFLDRCSPALSNLSYISKTLLKFGDVFITDAYVVPPVVHPPGFLLVVSTYNGILTLSVSYYKSTIRKNYFEKLLDRVKCELITGCRQ